MDYRCILLDFDFTLADSSGPVVKCVRHALAAVGASGCTDPEILRTVGLPLREMFRILAPGRDEAVLTASFMEKAEEIMVEGTTLYEEVPDALAALKAAGMLTGIVSTKLRRRIERILEKYSLRWAFDTIVGAEDVARHKPCPDALVLAALRLGVDLNETLYVGDSVVDAEAARRARVAFCAVLHGVTRRDEFSPYNPVSVVTDVREILPLVGARTG